MKIKWIVLTIVVAMFLTSGTVCAHTINSTVETHTTITNAVPENLSICLSEDTDYGICEYNEIGAGIPVIPGEDRTVYVEVSADDGNGASDMPDGNATLELFDIAGGSIGYISLTVESTDGNTKTWRGTHNFAYYDSPSDADIGVDNYTFELSVADTQDASASESMDTRYQSSVSLWLGAESGVAITFDKSGLDMSSGETSDVKTLQVENYGNVVINAQISGAQMDRTTGGASIAVSNIQYVSSETPDCGSDVPDVPVTGVPTTQHGTFNLGVSLSGNGDVSAQKNQCFHLNVPAAQAPGDYVGTMTVSGIAA
jgi:hypothetical protein